MTFPAYSAYKDSGVEWLGEVPQHWYSARFSRVVMAIRDGTHGTFERVDAGVPLLSAKNVKNGFLDISENESLISEADSKSIVSNGFPAVGDLLLTIVGTIGRSCVYETDQPLAFQRSVCFLRLYKQHCPYFFYYFSQSKFFQEQLVGRSKSSAQAGVYMGEVVATSVVFPPVLSEQIQIACFLDHETARIDALIEEQQLLIELLKEKRQAVISHGVTKGLDPTVPMKDSGVEWLGEVPAHWQVCKLSFRYSVELGKMLDEKKNTGTNPLPYLRNQDVQWGRINIDGLPLIDIEPSEYERYSVRLGDLLVCEGGDVGRAAIWRHKGNKIGYQKALHRLRPESPNRDTAEFFFFSLMAVKALGVFEESDTKATISHLPAEKFRQYRFAFPPIEDQQKIASVLRETYKRSSEAISYAENTITLLQERRSALISAAVTGKIDVRCWQPPASAQAPILEAEAV